MRCFALALALFAGCGEEIDVDVFVVLPTIQSQESLHAPLLTTCELAGASRVELAVTGPGPEEFTVVADECAFDGELEATGFFRSEEQNIRIERLLPEYYELAARIYDEDGVLRGERRRPFDARAGVLVVLFQRPDLHNWPTEIAGLYFEDCDTDPTLERIAFSITPEQAFGPIAEGEIICGVPPGQLWHDPAPNTVHVMAPVGPVTVEVEGFRAGVTDKPCVVAEERIVVGPESTHVPISFNDGCATGEGLDDQ